MVPHVAQNIDIFFDLERDPDAPSGPYVPSGPQIPPRTHLPNPFRSLYPFHAQAGMRPIGQQLGQCLMESAATMQVSKYKCTRSLRKTRASALWPGAAARIDSTRDRGTHRGPQSPHLKATPGCP